MELRQVVDADSNTWSAKQTFDSREKSGARHVMDLLGLKLEEVKFK